MEKYLPFHEFSAYLIPGVLLLFSALLLLPVGITFNTLSSISLGSLGIYVIASYAIGHIVQIIGRRIEWLIEKARGDFKNKEKLQSLLTTEQIALTQDKLKKLKITDDTISKISKENWEKFYRSIYEIVKKSGDTAKIDVYKAHSKACRGLGTDILLLLPLIIIAMWRAHYNFWLIILFFFVFILLSIALYDRMRGFDKRDAQSTYKQFLTS